MISGALPQTPRFSAFISVGISKKPTAERQVPAADTLEPLKALGVAPQRCSYPPYAESFIIIS